MFTLATAITDKTIPIYIAVRSAITATAKLFDAFFPLGGQMSLLAMPAGCYLFQTMHRPNILHCLMPSAYKNNNII